MNTKLICWLIGMLCALTLQAQNEYPTANPTMTYVGMLLLGCGKLLRCDIRQPKNLDFG